MLASLHAVYAGARWHERQVAELFGLQLHGHPGLLPLILPDGFVGHPLRKDFALNPSRRHGVAGRQGAW